MKASNELLKLASTASNSLCKHFCLALIFAQKYFYLLLLPQGIYADPYMPMPLSDCIFSNTGQVSSRPDQ